MIKQETVVERRHGASKKSGSEQMQCEINLNGPNAKENEHAEKSATTTKEHSTLCKVLHWNDIEEWQKDNEFIHSGYVASRNSMMYVLQSMTYLHNETVNIYSHLLPGVFSLSLMLMFISSVTPPEIIFTIGCFMCLTLSAVFHLFKSHSQTISILGNKLDYLGICVLIAASMIAILAVSFDDMPMQRYIFKGLSIVLGVACSYASLSNKFRTRKYRTIRALMFVSYGLSGVLPVIYGWYKFGFAEMSRRTCLPYLLAEGFFYILGAYLYAVRFPEKCNPGKFDIFGHSHQIFHFFVVIAAYCHYACIKGAQEYSKHRMVPASS